MQVGLGFGAVGDVVHARVAVAAHVVVAVATVAHAAQQRLHAVQAVKGGHAPAQHVDAGFITLDHGEVGHQGLRAQLGLDADACPHGGHGLADFFVVDVAVVGAGKVHFKTLRVTGFGEQFFGGLGVVRMACVDLFSPAVHLRGHQGTGGLREAPHGHAVDGVDVHRLVQRHAHFLVFERVFAFDVGAWQLVAELVHAKKDGAVFNAIHHLQRGRGAQAAQVLRARVQDEIHLARQQSRDASGFGLDGGVDDFGHVAGVIGVPVVGVFSQHQALVGQPFLHGVLASAHGVAVGKGFVFGTDVFGVHRLVFLGPGLAHDAQFGQLV